MQENIYQEQISWLFNQFPSYQSLGPKAYKPGIFQIQELLIKLKISISKVPYVHVAGTNGKGSTCSMMASSLMEKGYQVGLFTSPHIKDFRERIRINGEVISKNQVIQFIQSVRDLKLNFTPSFFEISVAMALNNFNEQGCDIAIIETGLGGCLDATNCIIPILSVITNISLEHQQFLGNTRQAIAREKAGIIKSNIPVVFGEFDDEIAPVFEEIINANNVEYYVNHEKYSDYLLQNQSLARLGIQVLNELGFQISEDHFTTGMLNLQQNTGLRARMEIINENPLTIVDAAHNVQGVKVLLAQIKKEYPEFELRIVFGTSSDKNLEGIIELFPKNAKYFITEFSNYRSYQLDQLKSTFTPYNRDVKYYNSPEVAMAEAVKNTHQNVLILIFGSFYLIEEFF